MKNVVTIGRMMAIALYLIPERNDSILVDKRTPCITCHGMIEETKFVAKGLYTLKNPIFEEIHRDPAPNTPTNSIQTIDAARSIGIPVERVHHEDLAQPFPKSIPFEIVGRWLPFNHSAHYPLVL